MTANTYGRCITVTTSERSPCFSHAPRTATVRCAQAGTLWPLRRADFVTATTGNSTTKEMIGAIVEQRLAHAGKVDLPPGDHH